MICVSVIEELYDKKPLPKIKIILKTKVILVIGSFNYRVPLLPR